MQQIARGQDGERGVDAGMNEIMSEEVVAAVMMDRPRVAVILPCYNEEAAIAQTIRIFREALPHADIHVYDNNSGDRTREIDEAAGAVARTERIMVKVYVVRRPFSDVGVTDSVL